MIYCLSKDLMRGAESLRDHYNTYKPINEATRFAKEKLKTALGVFSLKQAPVVKSEEVREFDGLDSTNDESVTLVGHTDDSRDTVGDKSPEQIAAALAAKYGQNKGNLKEIFLFACEAGVKTDQANCFAQDLADELVLQGFSENLIVHSVEPPEGTYSMYVGVTSKSLGGEIAGKGQIEAYAYKNKESAEYDRAKAVGQSAQIAKPQNYSKQNIIAAEIGEVYQDTFRRAGKKYQATGPNLKEQNNAAIVSEGYLKSILDSRGIFKKIMAMFGSPALADEMKTNLDTLNQKEAGINAKIAALKDNISRDVGLKIGKVRYASSNDKWKDLKNYLDSDQAAWATKRKAAAALFKHEDEFTNADNGKKTLNGQDERFHTYKDVYNELRGYHQELANINRQKNEIRGNILEVIDKYQGTHKGDPAYAAKIAVMQALRAYVSKPTPERWQNIEKATRNNPGWDKGFFSQVGKVHEEITMLRMSNKL
jgi:hypothetical protein